MQTGAPCAATPHTSSSRPAPPLTTAWAPKHNMRVAASIPQCRFMTAGTNSGVAQEAHLLRGASPAACMPKRVCSVSPCERANLMARAGPARLLPRTNPCATCCGHARASAVFAHSLWDCSRLTSALFPASIVRASSRLRPRVGPRALPCCACPSSGPHCLIARPCST